jgi:hypothetical protein
MTRPHEKQNRYVLDLKVKGAVSAVATGCLQRA